jgi:hypothetical protein
MSRALLALATGLLVCGAAEAAILIAATPSAVGTSVVAPPVTWELGPAGASSRWFSPLTVSANATHLTGSAKARAGADWTAYDVARLVNGRASAQSVTLSAAQLTNAQLDLFKVFVYDGSTLVGTLDLEAASPSLTFTIPASGSRRVDLRLDLADGAGANNAPASFSLSVRVATGGITVAPGTSTPALAVSTVDVPFGKLVSGSSVGSNATNASGSAAAAVALAGSTDYFYINNTATSPSYVKIVETTATAGISALATMNIGVRNSTGVAVEHVKLSSGSFTQTSGSYQRLEPSSTNYLYVRSLEGVLFGSATIGFDLYASDTSSGASFALSKGTVTLT